MSFDEWWQGNAARLMCESEASAIELRIIAEEAWNAQEERVEVLHGIALKSIKKNRAFRDVLKRSASMGCMGRGRCKSKRVDEDFCMVCRPIMNVLSDHDPTPDEVLKAICEDNLD